MLTTRKAKTIRKPLQPTNSLTYPKNTDQVVTKMSKNMTNLHIPFDCRNKENYVYPMEDMMESSLAEELKAMRERKERVRVEREKTEAVMKERGMMMERKMEEMREREEVQRRLEVQVDWLFRLKEIKSLCKKNTPIRSLREKEHGGKIKEREPQGINSASTSECMSGSQPLSSSSEIHTEN